MFDRAVILREAHAATRARIAPSHYQRHGDRYDATCGVWVPKAALTYRAIFAAKLRNAWHMARSIAEAAALEAALPQVDDATFAKAATMRAAAWGERFTPAGDARAVAAHLAAASLIEAARFASFFA